MNARILTQGRSSMELSNRPADLVSVCSAEYDEAVRNGAR